MSSYIVALMPYHLSSEKTPDYILINSTGQLLTLEELRAHSMDVYREFAQYDHNRVLIINNTMEYVTNVFSYYELVNKHYFEELPSDVRQVKIALYINEEYKEIGKFWEDLCVNLGYTFHCFLTEEEAVKWLNSD